MPEPHDQRELTKTPPPPSDLADGAWHRVHPLTPVLKSGALLIALLGIGLSRLEDAARSTLSNLADGTQTSSHQHSTRWFLAGALLLAALTVALLANWLAWRKHEFRFDDDSLHVRKGIVGKHQRKARFDRVQAIDVDQALLPRLLGLAQLKFDVAGGRGSKLVIEYLRRTDAEALRATMLEHVRVSRETSGSQEHGSDSDVTTGVAALDVPREGGSEIHGAAAPGTAPAVGPASRDGSSAMASRPGAPVGSRIVHGLASEVLHDLGSTLTEALAPYRVRVSADAAGAILRVPPHRVLLAQFMTPGPLVGALVFVATVVLLVVGASTGHAAEALSITVTLLFMVFGFVHAAVRQFLRDANFSVVLTRDGIVVTHGLTSTTRRVIPIDRIQAVELAQPWLWRRPGWWRVRMNLASGAVRGDGASSVLLPVGSLDDALMLMGLVLPEPGTPAEVSGRELMVEAMTASRTSGATPAAALFTGSGPHAGLLDPLTARREAWARTQTMTVIRRSRLARQVVCVPHARVQSMALTQGPLERRLGLATLHLHSTSGIKPRIAHQREDVAQRFLVDHADVTRRAREALDGR